MEPAAAGGRRRFSAGRGGAATTVLLLAIAAGGAAPPAAAPSDRPGCLRCHGMATLAALDEHTGRLVRYAVDPAGYAASEHGRLDCGRCHDPSAAGTYPHGPKLARERLRCLKCHKEEARFLKRRFPEIGAEVRRSVHAIRLKNAWSCFACHDPHSFKAGAGGPAGANAVCLGCHAAPARFAALTTRPLPDLAAAHAWLPSPGVHARLVRCVDCHASAEPPDLGHAILPAAKALRDCVGCHSRNTRLLATLYRHQVREGRERLGFVNATLLNDAYVIGATRNVWLDRASGVVFAGALLGLLGHAVLRRARGGRP